MPLHMRPLLHTASVANRKLPGFACSLPRRPQSAASAASRHLFQPPAHTLLPVPLRVMLHVASTPAAAARPTRSNTPAASPCLHLQAQQQQRRLMTVLKASQPQQMTASAKTEPTEQVVELWRTAEAVCFDVDSTFCADESIDEIAAFLGVGEQVAALTAQAMGGSVLFQDALASRLNLMGLSRQRLDEFLKAHPAQITPGIPELVSKLQAQGKGVFLVSGGFRQVIHPIAESLGIPVGNVFANNLLFKDDGSYAGFDPEEFTSRSGGKAEAVRHIRKKYGYSRVAMVGDGATDLEARLPDAANIFIGYGGVVERPNIAAHADWYLYKIQPLIDALG